jgi:hypothetical protein
LIDGAGDCDCISVWRDDSHVSRAVVVRLEEVGAVVGRVFDGVKVADLIESRFCVIVRSEVFYKLESMKIFNTSAFK